MTVRTKPAKPSGASALAGRGRISGGTKVGWIGLVVLFGAAAALYALDLNRSADNSSQTNSSTLTNINPDSNQSNANSAGGSAPILPAPNIDSSKLEPPQTTADLPKTESACQSAEGSWNWANGQCQPGDKETCETFDGLWGPIGQSIPEGCSLLTDDSGRACQDSSECAGYCLLADSAGQNSMSRDDELADATGQCSSRTLIRGCYAEVTRGLAGVKCF